MRELYPFKDELKPLILMGGFNAAELVVTVGLSSTHRSTVHGPSC
jgi:hypothetical protein